ncbi:hypothetical protein KSX89_06335 [Bacteroides eggerthii]|uniref:hypothetical protein n=1 Tax=Bacteroides eggerthii TaxID=28111 RepID=UPI001C37C72F|nr:hypothetical protein [Bacteroides eggerthii]MBV3843086.1 hypothetical protein [Bacteroides eggerthii]MBV3846415.1 hypothetical protein [Bacteroides eggerthii]MBV3884181.1 hypothetical protein [Bacteroides eggerthii]MBV3902291.1 hypothetical protein [Bacteroides eggerthii]MBV3919791.1 hypothetical protein [Bacteroides eggerthii]
MKVFIFSTRRRLCPMETLSYFIEKHELNKFVNYYLAKETEDGLSELEDVTKDLNQIFVKLAQPMNEIINIENLYRNYSHT